MKKFIKIILALTLTAVITLSGCSSKSADTTKPADSSKPLVVGFVYIGPKNDGGYSEAQDNGRKYLEQQLGNKVKTLVRESVPEGPECEKALRDLVDQGAKVIFSTSFGFMDYTEKVAKDNPDVIFLHCSGYKTLPNMGTYFGKIEEPRYLSGIVAGLKTKTNKIGYVAAFEIPECIRGINAFTLGVQSVNPKAQVYVRWTHTWNDPAKEKEAAKALLDEGVDVTAQHQDSQATQQAAAEKGAASIGYDLDPQNKVKGYMTSPLFNWGPYFVKTVKAVMDGTWKSESYWGPMSDGVVSLAPLTSDAPEKAAAQVDAVKQQMLAGTFKIFKGPIKDQAGTIRIKEGEVMPDPEVWNMDWFVQGVVGNPKSN